MDALLFIYKQSETFLLRKVVSNGRSRPLTSKFSGFSTIGPDPNRHLAREKSRARSSTSSRKPVIAQLILDKHTDTTHTPFFLISDCYVTLWGATPFGIYDMPRTEDGNEIDSLLIPILRKTLRIR